MIETKLEIKEYEPSKISKPNIIVGVPEAGLVGTISASYLIQQLKLPETGYIDSELVPPVCSCSRFEAETSHPDLRTRRRRNNSI